MSVKITNWVWHDERTAHLKGNTAMALLALADIADDDGHVVFARGRSRSQEALARKARMSVPTFRRVTASLAEEGLLEMSRETQTSEKEYRILVTAQNDRSDLSGQTVGFERSDRSQVSGHTSLIRSDVTDVSLSPDESDDTGTLIPAGWRPNQSHIDKAASLHLDVKREYQRFRSHAESKHRRQKNWNTAFTNWLRKGAEIAQQRQGVAPMQTFARQRQNNTLALVEQYREEESREEVGDRNAAGLQALNGGR